MKPQRSKVRSHRRRGATVVELAVVAPLVILLIFGLFEYTRMVMLQQALTNAAREGCRTAVLASTISNSDVDAQVRQYLKGTIQNPSDTNKVRVAISPAASLSTIASETAITITVDVTYSDVSLFPPWFLGGIEIHGEALMKRE